MVYKPLVPRTMIPKVNPPCIECGGGTKTVTATAFAEGYHRRHVCLNPECGMGFYTLAGYDGGGYATSVTPFRDRALNSFEIAVRRQWWDDYEKGNTRVELPRKVIPPLLARMADAIGKGEGERSPVDKFLVAGYQALLARVASMEQAKDEANGE